MRRAVAECGRRRAAALGAAVAVEEAGGFLVGEADDEEVFEEALSNYEEREFVRFVGKFGVDSLTKLSLTTQKKTLIKMLEAMEEKKFIGQYMPWLEQTVNLGIQHQVFAGPGIYHRFVALLEKLHEIKLLKRL